MFYEGYTGVYETEEDGSLYGKVINIKDVITFSGKDEAEIEQSFRDSVDDYLAYCKERGEEPNHPQTEVNDEPDE